MLRLDKTIMRKVPLHHDQDAEERARWQAISFAEKREVALHVQQRARKFHALREVGRGPERERNATSAKVADSAN